MLRDVDFVIDVLHRRRIVIVESGASSKKSTGLPWAVACSLHQQVVCTQPRRISAIRLASFVAKTKAQKQELGEEVGYIVSGNVKTSQDCKVVYVTEGVATQMSDEMLQEIFCC